VSLSLVWHAGIEERRGVGLGLVDLDIFLQRVDQVFLQIAREKWFSSAISRSATTGFLSLSRSTVI
jgi:hypothetical protein